MTDTVVVSPAPGPVRATVEVPGSRSITNRALVCAALAEGTSVLEGALVSDDTDAMAECLSVLGIRLEWDGGRVVVHGCAGSVPAGPAELFTRLSGTTSRFVLPLCTLGRGEYRVDAAPPMRARPMGELVAALRTLGAEIDGDDHLPITVRAGGPVGGAVTVRGDVSSQFLSALLLSGPLMSGGLRVTIDGELKSRPYVEMTRSVMARFGAEVREVGDTGLAVPPGTYRSVEYRIEPDASSACYLWAAAAATGGTVEVAGLDRSSIQADVRFLDVLEAMGCAVGAGGHGVVVSGPERLRSVDVDLSDCSDQAPTLGVLAALAEGTTRVRGIGFIRRKESDRIAAVTGGLRALGVAAAETDDGFVVTGGVPTAGRVPTHDDHRIAMSFGVLGLVVDGVEIEDPDCVDKTYPGFFDMLAGLAR